MSTQDYYEVIGVAQDAPPDEIKKNYRRLACELHPDVNPDPVTQEIFKEVTEAYTVLSDPQKRSGYDLACSGAGSFSGSFKRAAEKAASKNVHYHAVQEYDATSDLLADQRKSPAEKLDYAAKNDMLNAARALLADGAVPDPKTLSHLWKQGRRPATDPMTKLIATGGRPPRRS